MGVSSFVEIWLPSNIPAHFSCSQRCSQVAPQPHEPDASEKVVIPGGCDDHAESNEMPFHGSANLHHHCMSDLALALRRIKWSSLFTVVDRSMSHLRKDWPALTTLLACDSEPINDNKSLFLHAFIPCHWLRVCFSSINLSWRSRSSPLTESISIPRNVMHVSGSIDLDGSIGSPAHSQISCISCIFA